MAAWIIVSASLCSTNIQKNVVEAYQFPVDGFICLATPLAEFNQKLLRIKHYLMVNTVSIHNLSQDHIYKVGFHFCSSLEGCLPNIYKMLKKRNKKKLKMHLIPFTGTAIF